MAEEKPNFSGQAFENKADGFNRPTDLPGSEAVRATWQAANKAWWESTPMRYDWRDPIPYEKGTREYFEEIDRRFLVSVKDYLPWRSKPFESLIPYAELSQWDVLEIGVGQGTHAQLIAAESRNFTGIDLTEAAVSATSERFALFDLSGRIFQMDAEAMKFEDESFDYIWSWGVIHHSADTRRVLEEMNRVLRPGGRATVMVYHRNWWNFYVVAGLLKGLLQGQLLRRSLHEVTQGVTDGAIARYYRPNEWGVLAGDLFYVAQTLIFGQKSDMIVLPAGRLKRAVERVTPAFLTRLFTNTLRMGSFLVVDMRKL